MILVIGTIIPLASLYFRFEKQRLDNRKAYLDQALLRTTLEFEKGIEEYAVLVSGLRSYIIEIGRIPTPEEIQNYLKNQLEFVEYGHSVIINYIDKNHRFIYSVSEESLTPNELVGVDVSEIRDKAVLERLESFIKQDRIMTFPILNLVEGFAGFPINFTVKENGVMKGYIACIINIKNILEPIYDFDIRDEFRYRFYFDNDIEFDRERVQDGSKVYHNRNDTLRPLQNFENFIYNQTEILGLEYKIGINYKEADKVLSFVRYVRTSAVIIMAFILFSALLIYLFVQNYARAKDLERSNEDLYFMNNLLRKFIYAASHDLKQPVVNIDNFHGLIKRKFSETLGEKGNKYMEVISHNIDYMKTMLDDLLVYSRVIREKKEKGRVELRKVLDEIKETYPGEKILISYDVNANVYGIESEIHRLFQNLISNAIKYNDNEVVEINIQSRISKGRYEFVVSDNGIGIDEAHLELVFEEFQRLDKRKYKGTGLGLAICKEIVINHGGSIIAKRNEKGGTDFIFQLKIYA
ncbi:MAG: hypothetical protein HKN67_00815 [Saprospiraceae bacterium]|nr:hypothetical protein [Saprospiraceae bacterium]